MIGRLSGCIRVANWSGPDCPDYLKPTVDCDGDFAFQLPIHKPCIPMFVCHCLQSRDATVTKLSP